MFQISTGKFFEEDKKKRHDAKFVFYSNVQLSVALEVNSPLLKIDSVEAGSISCYVVSYQLITEEHPIIIKCGDQDFIAQFILLWSFYFNCIAKTQKEIVQKICREKKISTYDQQAASEISPETVKLGRRLEVEELEGFKNFIENVVRTDRKTYKSLVASLKIIDDAKETISTNFDLAYSTLVYAIESLSQKHDGYVPVWDDYYDDVRRKISPILEAIEEEQSEPIKKSLIEGKQFRLRKRLEKFVESYLSESFYKPYLGNNTNILRKSYLSRCLNNLYQLRSSFVHELKPLDVMLSSPHSPSSDYIVGFGEPYFTYSGLNRLVREIIINFSREKVTEKREIIEWTSETSSIITTELAAECWIQNPDGFHESKANRWFYEYVEMLNSKKVTDQSKVMDKIESTFDGSLKQNKRALIHYYWLYNSIHSRENNSWEVFLKKRNQFLGKCFNFYVVILYMNYELSYTTEGGTQYIDLEEFDRLYEKYTREKFYKSALSLSGFTEAGILAAAANIALSNDDTDRYSRYLNIALLEVANRRNKYALIEESLKNKEAVDLKVYFDHRSEGAE